MVIISIYMNDIHFYSGQFPFQNAKSSSGLRKLCSRHVCAVRLKLCINCSNLEGSYGFTLLTIMVSSLSKLSDIFSKVIFVSSCTTSI